jgi:hypothetical protein
MKLNYNFVNRLLKNLGVLGLMLSGVLTASDVTMAQEGYIVGDFHQHSTYTDGSYSIQHSLNSNNQYGLDWWANSEHGGGFTMDAVFSGLDLGAVKYWDQYNPNPIIGTVSFSGGHQKMWRWQSLRDFSFPQVLIARQNFPNKVIMQGYEMNPPGHEHASMGLIEGQFGTNPNCNALAEFEFKFDASDTDVSGGTSQGWVKSANPNNHSKTIEAVQWLQTNYPNNSYLIPAHPERQNKYSIAHFRDMNNAGPDVCFGFESQPGHQKGPQRGGYGTNAVGGGTYGGTGYFSAIVGGLWDAMLSEGRHWWLFSSSDFHETVNDFYPGEYQKTYTWVMDKGDPQSIIDGLRSGNSYVVLGDLIDELNFTAQYGNRVAVMGENINHGKSLVINFKVHDPASNNNNGENPQLDHIDLIMGDVTQYISPGDPAYNNPTVSTTRVIARFDAIGGITDGNGITSQQWQIDPQGYITVNYPINNLVGKHYFRLRGTNLGLNISGETDQNGNPLLDPPGTNTVTKAYHDLWFYSNPIFTTNNPNIPLKSWAIVLGGILMALLTIFKFRR